MKSNGGVGHILIEGNVCRGDVQRLQVEARARLEPVYDCSLDFFFGPVAACASGEQKE